MSDTTQNEARDTAGLIDADGRVVDEAAEHAFARVQAYIEENPITGAVIALAIGYVMGRLRLII
jgi:ElaB/YqjD/DUF883 family membrane-anchored ribosome-binding protein